MDGTSQEPAEWALRLIKDEGAKSAAGLARAWVHTYSLLTERMPHGPHVRATRDRWEARHKAVLALEALGFKGDR